VSGTETVVFSCFNQDQELDSVDFPTLRRLSQNGAQEKLTKAVGRPLPQAPRLARGRRGGVSFPQRRQDQGIALPIAGPAWPVEPFQLQVDQLIEHQRDLAYSRKIISFAAPSDSGWNRYSGAKGTKRAVGQPTRNGRSSGSFVKR